jgi:hypothetical protein
MWRQELKTVGGGGIWNRVEWRQSTGRSELLVQAERDVGSDDCTGSSWYIHLTPDFLLSNPGCFVRFDED